MPGYKKEEVKVWGCLMIVAQSNKKMNFLISLMRWVRSRLYKNRRRGARKKRHVPGVSHVLLNLRKPPSLPEYLRGVRNAARARSLALLRS